MRERNRCVINILKKVDGIILPFIGSVVVKAASYSVRLLFLRYCLYRGRAVFAEGAAAAPFILHGCIFILMIIGLSFADTFCSHRLSFTAIKKLRTLLLDHYFYTTPGAVEHIKAGDFTQMIVNDINVFEWFIAHITAEWGALFITFCFGVGMAGINSPVLSALFVCAAAVNLFLVFNNTAAEEERGLYLKQLGGEFQSMIIDGLNGMREILLYGKEASFFKSVAEKSGEYNRVSARYTSRTDKRASRITAVLYGALSVSVVLLWTRYPDFDTAASIAVLFYALSLLSGGLANTEKYGFIFGAARRVEKVLQVRPVISGFGPLRYEEVDTRHSPSVSFHHCTFSYPTAPEKTILHDVSFTLKNGESTAIVSESGGGKSTIAKLLERFYDVTSGEIRYYGTLITDLSEDALRRTVTLVPQSVFLFRDSLAENLRLGKPDAVQEEIGIAVRKAQADEVIEKKEDAYETMLGEAGSNLSGGERQRIALAQAFLKDSPVLILDEASSSLDAKNEDAVNRALAAVKAHKTLIVIAHRLATIRSVDRILFLKDGKIHGDGTYERLYAENEDFKALIGKMQESEIIHNG